MISIIIPTYNRNVELQKCLKSIGENSKYNNEIIVLHPFTGMEIESICGEYGAKLFLDGSRDVSNKKKSLWGMINKGIEMASSRYVCWLNDDNVVLKDWDKTVLGYFDKETALVVMKTKGINNNKEYSIMKTLLNTACANYAVMDKSIGIRFDDRFIWFHGDADISLQSKYIYNKKVLSTKERLVIHAHLFDSNRHDNEKSLQPIIDTERFYRKWLWTALRKDINEFVFCVRQILLNRFKIILGTLINNDKTVVK